ncbi:50S ribosomal protein L23 [Patescibacteria group bacterium]|nr:50S ribosomal protein L23 [Patescibacteria group bacterium]
MNLPQSSDSAVATATATEKKKSAAKVKKAPKPVATSSRKEPKVIAPNAYKLIKQPLISEKSTDLALLNKYVFVVPINANKTEVAKVIKSIYGVKPIKMNMVRRKGKNVRHGRIKGKKQDFKKVIVTLAKEDKIEVYEGV